LLDSGQAQDARDQLEQACQLDPQSARAFYLLAQAQTQIGQPGAARDSLETFQRLTKKETANLDTRSKNYDDGAFLRALALRLHHDAARIFLRQAQLDQAESHLRQAVVLDPEGLSGRELLATLLLQSRRLPEAQDACESLVRLRPEEPSYRVNYGTVLLQRHDARGVPELTRALELDPKQPQALNNLARWYLRAGRELPKALELCQQLVSLQPTAANYDLLGWALAANGRGADAGVAAARAVELAPGEAVYRERREKLLQKTP
jgi:Flp pilus assembly protein TadD